MPNVAFNWSYTKGDSKFDHQQSSARTPKFGNGRFADQHIRLIPVSPLSDAIAIASSSRSHH